MQPASLPDISGLPVKSFEIGCPQVGRRRQGRQGRDARFDLTIDICRNTSRELQHLIVGALLVEDARPPDEARSEQYCRHKNAQD